MRIKTLMVLMCILLTISVTGCEKTDTINQSNDDTTKNDNIVAATAETVTTGNIPKGDFELGDEYIIKLFKNDSMKNTFHFFVLSVDGENVNLIIDRNMNSSGEDNYGSGGQNSMNSNLGWGPYYYMEDVFEATHTWGNVPPISFSYTDANEKYTVNTLEDKYIQFKNDKGEVKKVYKAYNNGTIRARLPYLEELINAGCKNNDYGSCPLWLSNNLNYSEYVTGDKVTNNVAIKGYWTMSSDTLGDYDYYGFKNYHQIAVTYNGDYELIYSKGLGPTTDITVRPVISIPKDLLK